MSAPVKPSPARGQLPVCVQHFDVAAINTKGLGKPDPAHVTRLAESIGEIDLLNPITVDRNLNLIAGNHRLAACRQLGHETIPANMVDLDAPGLELARIDENFVRREIDALDRIAFLRARRAAWKRLHPAAAKPKPGPKKKGDPETVSFTKDTANKTGTTDRSVRQYSQVADDLDPKAEATIRGTEAAKSITELVNLVRFAPERQREVAQRVAESGEKVKAANRSLLRRDQVALVRVYRPPSGEYGVIVVDFPWRYSDELDGSDAARGGCPYPTMSIEEICAVNIPVAKDCAVFCWVTNSHLIDPEAYAVVARAWRDRYGLVPKQIRTWRKKKMGLGRVWRNTTEHLVRFERGNPVFTGVTQTTEFEAAGGEHSAKPQQAFDDIAALCASPSRLEMFAREGLRPGWITTGAEVPKKRGLAARGTR